MVFISEINKRFEFEDKKMSTIFGRSSNDSLVMKAVSISFQRVQECFWHPHCSSLLTVRHSHAKGGRLKEEVQERWKEKKRLIFHNLSTAGFV